MDADLKKVSASTPVIILRMTSPWSNRSTSPIPTVPTTSIPPTSSRISFSMFKGRKDDTGRRNPMEQRAFASFVKSHSTIVAYFHGNDNDNEFYTYAGPDSTIRAQGPSA